MTVHVLESGASLCGMAGVPKDWPEGHKWVSLHDYKRVRVEKGMCPGCEREAKKRLRSA